MLGENPLLFHDDEADPVVGPAERALAALLAATYIKRGYLDHSFTYFFSPYHIKKEFYYLRLNKICL